MQDTKKGKGQKQIIYIMSPDFIIIGAMKSGTTSLYHYLGLHPQIGMSRLKETDFFVKGRNLDKGIDWYKKLFRGNFLCYGEASPNYSKAHYFPGVPQEMHKYIPDAKLIYLVRDPVNRILSHYTHNYAAGREPYDMEKGLQTKQKFNKYLFCSKYYWQLQQYLEFFPEEQILIIPSSKLKNQRKSTLQKIFGFLEVDERFYSEKYESEFGGTSKMRKKGKVSRHIFESSYMDVVRTYLPNRLKRQLKSIILPSLKKRPQITPKLKDKLEESLKPDIEALRAYTGESFPDWSV